MFVFWITTFGKSAQLFDRNFEEKVEKLDVKAGILDHLPERPRYQTYLDSSFLPWFVSNHILLRPLEPNISILHFWLKPIKSQAYISLVYRLTYHFFISLAYNDWFHVFQIGLHHWLKHQKSPLNPPTNQVNHIDHDVLPCAAFSLNFHRNRWQKSQV